MSSSGLLCLKWNNHTSSFDKLLNNLHLRDMYSDGTIVCHGQFYPVHRFVLSTCSEYFEEIFRQSINVKSKHPFIIVKDIHPPQMEALLNYMYRGEVNVPQEMLPELIKAAEAFKIKGLAVPDDEPPPSKFSSSRERKRSSANLTSPSSQVKRSKRLDDTHSSKRDKINSKNENNTMHIEELQTEPSSSNMSKNYSSSSQKDTEELFIPDILSSEVKSEPTDIPEYGTMEEIPDQIAPAAEEDYLPSKELDIKDEKSFDSFTTAEPFPPYKKEENLPTDDQYDLAQSSPWDNSQGFEEESNLEVNDSAQGPSDDSYHQSTKTSMIEFDGRFPSEYPEFSGTPEKRHKCSYCSYATNVSTHLKDHLKRHTGERPFACQFCDHKARTKTNLQIHIGTHTGERPFRCQFCPYSAMRKQLLFAHVRKQHENMSQGKY